MWCGFAVSSPVLRVPLLMTSGEGSVTTEFLWEPPSVGRWGGVQRKPLLVLAGFQVPTAQNNQYTKWRIWGWLTLLPFGRKMEGRKGGRRKKEGGRMDAGKRETWSQWCLAGEERVFEKEEGDQCHSCPGVKPWAGSVEWPRGCPPSPPRVTRVTPAL